ncbi:ABC transporter ATP-binding protein [Nocardioides sp. KR10-350]|uniref:ABC transporter ATP-binding protein n=1 Tax=Nocardioides cheoyonin TaxID=3156615 RepID=UPI0032B5BE80
MSTTVIPIQPGTEVAEPLVEVADLSIGFHGATAVAGVSFEVRAGECVALVGESGSGKSITARSLVGLSGPGAEIRAATLRVDGRDALGFRERDWRGVRGRFAGLVMQDALVSLDPLQTVGSAVEQVLRRHAVVPRAEVAQRALDVLASVGMPDPGLRAGQYAHELSGGLRQRALIATAIAADPALIIADEPTTALDVTVQKVILDLLAEQVAAGTGMLLISHDLAVVSQIAHRIVVLRDGEVVETGTTAEILGRPQAAYTRRLLAAIPSAGSRGRRLSEVGVDDSTDDGGTGPVAQVTDRPVASAAGVDVERPVVEASGLRKTYRLGSRRSGSVTTALDDVSFSVGRGEVLGIVGESGSGKSTCAGVLLGLTRPEAGEVLLDGSPWATATERERRPLRHELQLVPQDPLSSFDPRYTVRKVIGENLRPLRLGKTAVADRSVDLLRQVGLDERFLDRHPRTLSGGQRQRVAIARALAPNPRVLVCDEAVSALDVNVQAQVLDLLGDLREAHGTALVFISHDLGVVHHVADRVLVFHRGSVVEQGDVDDVFLNPQHDYTRRLVAAVPTMPTQESTQESTRRSHP